MALHNLLHSLTLTSLALVASTTVACGDVSVSPIDGNEAGGGQTGAGAAGGVGAAGGIGGGGGSGGATGGAGGAAGTGGTSGSGGGSNAACAAEDDFDVVACGLSPNITLFGVDAEALYMVSTRSSSTQSFFRVEKASGKTTRLYKSISSSAGDPRTLLQGVHLRNGNVYFINGIEFGGGLSFGLQYVAADGSGSLSTAYEGGNMSGFMSPIAMTDGYVFFNESGSNQMQRGTLDTFSNPLTLNGVYGDPLHVADGFVYYANSKSILRAPIDGGMPETVAEDAYESSLKVRVDVTFDDTHVYFPEEGEFMGTHYIKRALLAGGGVTTVLEIPDMESGEGPTQLRVAGDVLYFHRGWALRKISKAGGDVAEHVGFGEALSPPVFDETYGYATIRRGDDDSPIEGAIVRFER